jgi:hypothetical protein
LFHSADADGRSLQEGYDNEPRSATAVSALGLAFGSQLAACTAFSLVLFPAALAIVPRTTNAAQPRPDQLFIENDLLLRVYAIQRLRKAAGGGGASDMEKIADTMGHSFACMESKLCRKPVVGAVYGYD